MKRATMTRTTSSITVIVTTFRLVKRVSIAPYVEFGYAKIVHTHLITMLNRLVIANYALTRKKKSQKRKYKERTQSWKGSRKKKAC